MTHGAFRQAIQRQIPGNRPIFLDREHKIPKFLDGFAVSKTPGAGGHWFTSGVVMLVLSRKKDESVVINNDIRIVVVEISRGQGTALVWRPRRRCLSTGVRFIKQSTATIQTIPSHP